MAVLKRDADQHTYADYLIWSNTYGDELIDGTAYVREPPSPSWSHQRMVVELSHQIGSALEDKPWRVCVAPLDVRLPKAKEAEDEIDTVVQPDVLIVCDLQKLDERGVRGAPDWIAEVLSPSTASHDRTVKLPAYERAGVPEVWLIDPIDLTMAVYRLEGSRYGQPTLLELKGQTPLSAVAGVCIDWERLVARL